MLDHDLSGGAIPVGSPLFHATGCAACGNEGFRGRHAIYEVVEIDAALRALIHDGVAEAELEAAARGRGPSLAADGAAKVASGVTTVEEVARVVRDEA